MQNQFDSQSWCSNLEELGKKTRGALKVNMRLLFSICLKLKNDEDYVKWSWQKYWTSSMTLKFYKTFSNSC